MIKQIERKWDKDIVEYVCEFILDSESDVQNLPSCATGSVAIVATEGLPVYMVNASGKWVKVC